mmetsp:Transcript_47175/g.86585  ORF Transcript_47175/g.86585 Transcript_47175/m.86585 type:complete len:269 (+) Transcript_47175:310-1116(+)
MCVNETPSPCQDQLNHLCMSFKRTIFQGFIACQLLDIVRLVRSYLHIDFRLVAALILYNAFDDWDCLAAAHLDIYQVHINTLHCLGFLSLYPVPSEMVPICRSRVTVTVRKVPFRNQLLMKLVGHNSGHVIQDLFLVHIHRRPPIVEVIIPAAECLQEGQGFGGSSHLEGPLWDLGPRVLVIIGNETPTCSFRAKMIMLMQVSNALQLHADQLVIKTLGLGKSEKHTYNIIASSKKNDVPLLIFVALGGNWVSIRHCCHELIEPAALT